MKIIRPFAVCLVVLIASSCAPKRKAKPAQDPSAKPGADGAPLAGQEAQEASARGVDFKSDSQLAVVTFDYDSSTLGDEARAALARNAELMKFDPKATFQVAGHCDERGTIEYNLALGQRRAREVREYYRRLGIDGRRVSTISYGNERLPCAQSTEDCWRASRRAETLVAK